MNPAYNEIIHFSAGLLRALNGNPAVGDDVINYVALYTEAYLQARFGQGIDDAGKAD